tara:strand:+ start:572 stop:799 length:228 start_codon:yes stop_codon:yes gene_type:complete
VKVERHITYCGVGKRESDDSDAVVGVSDIEIRLNPKQLKRVVADLADLDPARTCKETKDLQTLLGQVVKELKAEQ